MFVREAGNTPNACKCQYEGRAEIKKLIEKSQEAPLMDLRPVEI
jgi:hypothetical protein